MERLINQYYFEKDGAVISIHAEDPELLKDVDPKKIAAWNKAAGLATKENRKYTMNDINSWCVISAPTKAWAKKVFPDLSEEEAVDKLWESILDSARVGEDPVENWNEHVTAMDSHADFLNEKQFRYLHYRNSKGTDLKSRASEKPPLAFCGKQKCQRSGIYCKHSDGGSLYIAEKRRCKRSIVFNKTFKLRRKSYRRNAFCIRKRKSGRILCGKRRTISERYVCCG